MTGESCEIFDQKNTVQETLVIPVYARKMRSERYPRLFYDETALRLIEQVDYDFSALEKKSGSLMHFGARRMHTVNELRKIVYS